MTGGIVAIDVERLEALAGALADAAVELLAVRAAARRLPAPELGMLAAGARALDDGAVDARRSAGIVRLLPSIERPPHTSVVLGRPVPGPHRSSALARRLPEVRRLLRLRQVERGHVAAALDALLLAVGDDPRAAAAALAELGVHGLRTAYELAAAEAGLAGPDADLADLDEAGRLALEDRLAALTRIVLLASRTVGQPGGMSRRLVDELLPAGGPRAPGTRPRTGGASAASQVLGAAGAGHAFVEAAAAAVGSGHVGLIVRAGRVLAFGTLALGVVEGLAAGGDGLAESLLTGGLGLLGSVAGGPVGWFAGGLSLLLTVAFAVGARPGRPPARTYPTDRRNPGGSHYVHHVDGAGVPVDP